jgi:hypothetical protein
VKVLREIDATLDPENGTSENRERLFVALAATLTACNDAVRVQMSKVMLSFINGLFVGGDDPTLPRDNLDLERFFRCPKGHERRIHGRSHAGVRLVHRGPVRVMTLAAHIRHQDPFSAEDLDPWRSVTPPQVLLDCRRRAQVMRRARSSKQRPLLLSDLERRFEASIQRSLAL